MRRERLEDAPATRPPASAAHGGASGAAGGWRADALIGGGMALSLGAVALAPWHPLALLALALFVALTWWRLDLALCLLPLTFPYWYVPRALIGHAVFPLSEIALAAGLGVALVRAGRWGWRTRRRGEGLASLAHRWREHAQSRWQRIWRRLGPATMIGGGLLLLGVTLGVLVARRPHEALRTWRWTVIEPLLYVALLMLFVRGERAARWLLWALLGSALVVAALAMVQVFWLHVTFTPLAAGSRLVPYLAANGSGVPRATGIIYGSGNSLGAWLERALPPALALALARESTRRTRLLAAVCALAYLPALLWSDSRGAQVGAAVGCGVVLVALVGVPVVARARLALRHGRGPRPALLGLFVVVALVAVSIAIWQGAALANAVVYGHGGSGEVRLLVWLAALHMIRDHPLLGIGPDQFLYYYSTLYTTHPYWILHLNGHRTLVWREPDLAHPHNLVLDLWLSAGLLGLVGFGLLAGSLARRSARLWRADAGWRGAVALGVGASVLAGLVHGMVDSAYFVPDLALAFWWAVGLLAVLASAPSPRSHNQ